MEYLGTFNAYTPESFPPGMPEALKKDALWLRNEFGEDLYEIRNRLSSEDHFITAEADGHIRVVHDDPTRIWPANGGMLYVAHEEISTDPSFLMTKRFNHETMQIEDRPVVVPVFVTRAQALMALYNAGLLDQVRTAVNSHEYPPVKIWFDNALNFERDHAYLQAIAYQLGLSETQVDDLFIAASRLSA